MFSAHSFHLNLGGAQFPKALKAIFQASSGASQRLREDDKQDLEARLGSG